MSNNNLQFDKVILDNEAIVLEGFIQIFGIAARYFSEFLTISKKY
jgi:hypothetical protein